MNPSWNHAIVLLISAPLFIMTGCINDGANDTEPGGGAGSVMEYFEMTLEPFEVSVNVGDRFEITAHASVDERSNYPHRFVVNVSAPPGIEPLSETTWNVTVHPGNHSTKAFSFRAEEPGEFEMLFYELEFWRRHAYVTVRA